MPERQRYAHTALCVSPKERTPTYLPYSYASFQVHLTSGRGRHFVGVSPSVESGTAGQRRRPFRFEHSFERFSAYLIGRHECTFRVTNQQDVMLGVVPVSKAEMRCPGMRGKGLPKPLPCSLGTCGRGKHPELPPTSDRLEIRKSGGCEVLE